MRSECAGCRPFRWTGPLQMGGAPTLGQGWTQLPPWCWVAWRCRGDWPGGTAAPDVPWWPSPACPGGPTYRACRQWAVVVLQTTKYSGYGMGWCVRTIIVLDYVIYRIHKFLNNAHILVQNNMTANILILPLCSISFCELLLCRSKSSQKDIEHNGQVLWHVGGRNRMVFLRKDSRTTEANIIKNIENSIKGS